MKFLSSIRTKVWLTVLIVFAGFFIATLSGFSLNARLSEHLTHLHEYDFSLAMKSAKAQSAFREQTALYEEAYLTGNREAAVRANIMAADVLAILDEMIRTVESCPHTDHTTPFLRLFLRHYAAQLASLRLEYRDFISEASTIYLRASRNEDTPELRTAIRRLGEVKAALHRRFAETEVRYVGTFEQGIDHMRSETRREALFLLSLFVGVLVLSAAVTHFVASRLLITPLRRLHDQVSSFARGVVPLPPPAHPDAGDEIGALARAFYRMTMDLQRTTVSKQYVDNIIRSMTDSLVVVSPHGTITNVNEQTLVLLGYTAEELVGRPFASLFSERDDDPVLFRTSGSRTMLRHPMIRNLEKRYQTKDGRTIPVLLSLSAMTSADGEFLGLVSVARDITERLQAEEALRESERDLRSIMNSVRAGIIIVDPLRRVIVDANAHALAMIGAAREDVVGRDPEALFKRPESASGAAVGPGDPPADAEGILRRADGRMVPVLRAVVPVQYRGASHHIDSFIDISQLKEAEARLQALAGELRRSNEELKEINDELKNFTYIVSHDLRAPLVNIRGFSNELAASIRDIRSFLGPFLERAAPEERARLENVVLKDVAEALHFISSSVVRMESLINAILNLSRIGRRELKPEPLDVTEIVRSLVATLTHQIEERSARVTIGDLPSVVADRTALEQIFGNLLDNAVKYLVPDRPGDIQVSGERRNGEFLFRVCDNGRGIAAEDIPKIFDLFRRAGAQDVPGEGMGLAYVRTLIRRHGGRIWCDSVPGEGTTFSFTLPAETR